MTIAITLKVNDGVVLAADSASSIVVRDQNGATGIANVYDNANKVFNLHKKIPVGIITWGCGSIGLASTSTLIKDFRELITNHPEHRIDPESYTVENIARKFYEFIYLEKYTTGFSAWDKMQRPSLGFIIAGYSTGADMGEEWRIDISEGGDCDGPTRLRALDEVGMNWNGVPEVISRVVLGHSPALPVVLQMAGLTPIKIGEIQTLVAQHLQSPMIIPAMPIQDVIDIAHFLVDLTIKYVKYTPGPPTVGGPIEVAAITKHEGFKWISRKHYFQNNMNS